VAFTVAPRKTDRAVTLNAFEIGWARQVADAREAHPRNGSIGQRTREGSHFVGIIGELAAARFFGAPLHLKYHGGDDHVDMVVAFAQGREYKTARVAVKTTTFTDHENRFMTVPMNEVDAVDLFVGVLTDPSLDGRCWLYGYATAATVRASERGEIMAGRECYFPKDRQMKRFRGEARAESMALVPLDADPPVDFVPVINGVREHVAYCACSFCE
jgi:hypothetical protein